MLKSKQKWFDSPFETGFVASSGVRFWCCKNGGKVFV